MRDRNRPRIVVWDNVNNTEEDITLPSTIGNYPNNPYTLCFTYNIHTSDNPAKPANSTKSALSWIFIFILMITLIGLVSPGANLDSNSSFFRFTFQSPITPSLSLQYNFNTKTLIHLNDPGLGLNLPGGLSGGGNGDVDDNTEFRLDRLLEEFECKEIAIESKLTEKNNLEKSDNLENSHNPSVKVSIPMTLIYSSQHSNVNNTVNRLLSHHHHHAEDHQDISEATSDINKRVGNLNDISPQPVILVTRITRITLIALIALITLIILITL